MAVQLEQAVIAITGAGSGIGKALALKLAASGAYLALADNNQARLDEVVADCAKLTRVIGTVVDVSQQSAIESWADNCAAEFSHINVIVNNAGVSLSAGVETMPIADFKWLMDINFWGVVYGSKAFLPYLQQSDWGRIVNISSLFGLVSMPNQSAYNAAKFAVRGFSESLAIELKQTSKHIGLSCVHPGGVKTNIANDGRFLQRSGKAVTPEQQKQRFNDKLAKTTAEQAADEIIGAIVKKRSRVLIGSDAKLIDLIQRLMPSFYKSIVAKVMV